MELCKCLFEARGESVCAESGGKLIKLSDCKSSIDDSLRKLNVLSHFQGQLLEYDLILNRSVICVSCFNLHKVKLEENDALMKQKGGKDNEQDDNPLVKCIASMKISAAVSSTPSVTPAAKAAEWTTGCRPSDCSSGEEDVSESVAESAISEFNAAMGKLNEVSTTRQ
ncbi:unnamed protein product, partial [Porites lobata]